MLFSGLTEVDVDSGDISVGSTSGKLKAVTKSGNINVNLSQHDDIKLKTNEGKLLNIFKPVLRGHPWDPR